MTGKNIHTDMGPVPKSDSEAQKAGHDNQVSGNLQYPFRRRIKKAPHNDFIDNNESNGEDTKARKDRRGSGDKGQELLKSPKQ